jgi:hypothetical protein
MVKPVMHRRVIVATSCLLALAACYFCARSVHLGISLIRPLPWFDQWAFVKAYFRYLDGSETLLQLLFAQHNTHRIVTMNIFLLIDAQTFDMRGIFPIIVMYIAAALIAFLIARLTVKSRTEILICFPIVLAAMWSISQYRVLNWPFFLGWPFVHLCALVCYQTLAVALTIDGPRRYTWLAVACLADAVGIFSFGSGPFIGLPAIALAIWLQKLDRVCLSFVATHTILTACYFFGFVWPPVFQGGVFDWTAYLYFVVGFFGVSAGGLYTGAMALITFIAAISPVSWAAVVKGRKTDAAAGVLLALATFIAVEVVIASFGRVIFGVGPRYAMASMIFLVALLAFSWRMTSALEKWETVAQVGVLGLAAALIIAANLPRYETLWREHVAFMDRATAAFKKDEYPADIIRPWVLSPYPGLEDDVKQLAKLRLGPFAP